MFYSVMGMFHEKLPCSVNFFRQKEKQKITSKNMGGSPVVKIASPRFFRQSSGQESPLENSSQDNSPMIRGLGNGGGFGDAVNLSALSPGKRSKFAG